MTVTKVTDGTSKTIAIIEKAVWNRSYQPVGDGGNQWDWTRFRVGFLLRLAQHANGVPIVGSDAADAPGYKTGPRNDADIKRGTTWGRTIRIWSASFGNYADIGVGSPHTGVMNAVFGDASVHAIPVNIDRQVLFMLGCRDDGGSIQSIGF